MVQKILKQWGCVNGIMDSNFVSFDVVCNTVLVYCEWPVACMTCTHCVHDVELCHTAC
jgi:hypothetical protein